MLFRSTLTMPIPSVSGYSYTVMLFPTVFPTTFHQLFPLCVQKRHKVGLVCSCNLFFCILHFPHPFPSVLLTDCYKLISRFRFFFTACCFASRSAHSFFFSSSFLRREVFFSGFCSDCFTGCCSAFPFPSKISSV